jgi:NADPH-dependent ferric siderophore reductase
MQKHEIRKVRLEALWRTLTVTHKQQVTPQFLRIHFESRDLQGFDSPSSDDHVKLLLDSKSSRSGKVMRDFTPRAWDAAAGTFVLDFALHAAGPAVEWARGANIGDTLQVGGPRGSVVVPDDFDWYLLVGDATALPSIGRRLESLRAGVPVTVFGLVPGEAEIQTLDSACEVRAIWLISDGDAERDLSLLHSALAQHSLPPGDGFIWAAGECALAREVYSWAVKERGHPLEWVKTAEYWTRNV